MTDASLTTKLNRPNLPLNETSQHIDGRVTVAPGMQTDDPDLQIAVVVDTSGSMAGDRIETAREGAKRALGYLDDDDMLTVVGFNSNTTVALEATRYGGTARDEIEDAIDGLTAGGGTDIHGGLDLASEQLRDLPSDDSTVRRILLLSDGEDNIRGPEDFERQARDIDEYGIRIRAGGIGEDYNEETIKTLGSTSRGQWSHIDESGEIQEFFGEALTDAETVVGSDAELRMDIADGVEFTSVHRAKPQVQEVEPEYPEPNVAVVKLPDLLERETQRILLEIHVPGSTERETVELADITLEAGTKSATGSFEVTYTDDDEKLAVEHKDVSIERDKTLIRKDLGDGDVESAEDGETKLREKYGEGVDTDDISSEVTHVKKGGRAEQDEATKVKPDDGPV